MPDMSMSTADETATAEETLDLSVARAERRLRLLEELSEIGMELARALKPGAEPDKTTAGDAPAKDPAAVFAPLSRAVRLTLALEARTDQDLRDLKAGVSRARQERRERAPHEAEAREEKISELVLKVAERECESREAFEEIEEALQERLDLDEAYFDCSERPLRQTVERLCKDLALTPDWSRWAGEGWEEEDIPTRPRFSPFHQPSPRLVLTDDEAMRLLLGPNAPPHPDRALE
jgi:hypothetical protein